MDMHKTRHAFRGKLTYADGSVREHSFVEYKALLTWLADDRDGDGADDVEMEAWCDGEPLDYWQLADALARWRSLK